MARERDHYVWKPLGRRGRREDWEDEHNHDAHEDYEQGLGGSGRERRHGHTRFGQDFYDPSDYGREYGGHDSRGRNYSWQEEAWMRQGEHTGRGPKGYARSDERIAEEVNERLTRHGQLDASDIEVRVENGEVTLSGSVDSRRSKRLAEDAVETVWGVRDVHNRLTIASRSAENVGGRTDQKQS
jgi:hypothetical protein